MGTILIATDGSQAANAAVEFGLDLAADTEDAVVIVSVWDMIRGGIGAPLGYIDEEYIAADRASVRAVLNDAKAVAAARGIEVEAALAEGEPVYEICRAAREHDVRMIVIGAHGWGAVRGLISGSVVAGVLAHAPCPVLTGVPGSREFPGDREARGRE